MTMKVFSPSDTQTRQPNPWERVGLGRLGSMALMDKINLGLEGEIAKRISNWALITPTELRKMSGIPDTTFNRGIKNRFTADQSERIVRVIRIIERTVELFEGDKEAALKWLNESNRGLSWKKPADILPSETGALEVMRLITRIQYGVY